MAHEITISATFNTFPDDEDWLEQVAEFFERNFDATVHAVGSRPTKGNT